MQEQVRERLAATDVDDAEDSSFEIRHQAGMCQGLMHLGVGSAGCHAVFAGHRLQHLVDAGYGFELPVESGKCPGLKIGPECRVDGPVDAALDFRDAFGRAATHERIDGLLQRKLQADFPQCIPQQPVGDELTVDQNAIAVEYHHHTSSFAARRRQCFRENNMVPFEVADNQTEGGDEYL